MKRYIKSVKDITPEFLTEEEYTLFIKQAKYAENLFKNNFSSDINNYFGEKILEYVSTKYKNDDCDCTSRYPKEWELDKSMNLYFNCNLKLEEFIPRTPIDRLAYAEPANASHYDGKLGPANCEFLVRFNMKKEGKFVLKLSFFARNTKPFPVPNNMEIQTLYDKILELTIGSFNIK